MRGSASGCVPTMLRAGTALAMWAILAAKAGAAETSLTVADLPAYRHALSGLPSEAAVRVGFRELWEHPASYRGRCVRVEGRVLRRFGQPAWGQFPALEEVWIATASGNLICLVSPAERVAEGVGIGVGIGFEGTFLRLVHYPGRDAERLAPLIVGPWPPTPLAMATESEPEARGGWILGLGLTGVVAAVLLGQHLRRPVSRPATIGARPTFVRERDDGSEPPEGPGSPGDVP